MARKRPEFSVPEIEPRGFQAAVRPPDVVEAEARQVEPPQRLPTPARQPARTLARSHARTTDETADVQDLVRQIRRTVRAPGKEVVYVRLTPEEKTRLRDLAYSYQRQGTKTSDTEIARIAINQLLEDHERHGEASLLARVFQSMQD
jgi:hypothetical protein